MGAFRGLEALFFAGAVGPGGPPRTRGSALLQTAVAKLPKRYSHSIVAGGLWVRSWKIALMPFTDSSSAFS